MPRRRHRKPRTAAGLTGHHLGMVIRVDGAAYRLLSVRHGRARVEVYVEWPDLGDDETAPYGEGKGHLALDPGTPVSVVDWAVRFRPTLGEKLRAARAEDWGSAALIDPRDAAK